MPFLVPFLPAIAGVVGAGATLYAANKSSDAAQSAAATQSTADQAAISEQQREFNTNQTNLQPWLTAGHAALTQQMQLLGLGGGAPAGGATAAPTVGGVNVQKLLADNPDIAAWVQAGHGDPSISGQQTPDQAVNYWVKNGIALGDPRAINAPTYSQADVTAAGADPNSPQAQQQAAITALQSSPLYQSLYRNGQNTILQNASATGGLRGGNIQRSLANFGSDTLASVIQQQLSNLGGISGQGITTGGNLGTLGNSTSSNISTLLTQQGAAQAGGILASAGIGNGGLSSALSQFLNGAGQSYAAYRAQPSASSGPVDPYSVGVI